jgi:hypothetical protein
MMSSEERTIHSLLQAFPLEEVAIRKYFKLLASVRKATLGFVGLKFMPLWLGNLCVCLGLVHIPLIMPLTRSWFKYASTSTTDMLLSLTNNPTLRAVLGYNFGDYGTTCRDAPFSMHAVLNNHFLKVRWGRDCIVCVWIVYVWEWVWLYVVCINHFFKVCHVYIILYGAGIRHGRGCVHTCLTDFLSSPLYPLRRYMLHATRYFLFATHNMV